MLHNNKITTNVKNFISEFEETENKKYRAKEIVEIMKGKGYSLFTTNKMTDFWRDELHIDKKTPNMVMKCQTNDMFGKNRLFLWLKDTAKNTEKN